MKNLMGAYKSKGWLGLVLNVVTVWLVLGASLLMLVQMGSGFGAPLPGGPQDAPWTPPGAFIGAMWVVLYTLMGASLWLLNRAPESTSGSPRRAVLFLIGFCIVWPFYAFDTPNRWPGLLGNLGILVIAVFATWRLWPLSRAAALMIAPVAIWITIATASILDSGRRFGW